MKTPLRFLLALALLGAALSARAADPPARAELEEELPRLPAAVNGGDPLANLKQEFHAGHYDKDTSPTQQIVMLATLAQDGDLIELLKKAGGDIDAPDKEGRYTALNMFAMNDLLPGVKFLLKHGANPNGSAPLTPSPVLYESIGLVQDAIVKALLAAGADPDRPENVFGNTPLLAAATDHHTTHALILLKAGADPDKANNTGAAPLHMSVTLEDVKFSRLLLQQGANPNVKTKAGTTPLKAAIARRSAELEKLLRDYGAK